MPYKYQDIIDQERIELAKKLAKMDRNLKKRLYVLYSICLFLLGFGLIKNDTMMSIK